MTDRVAQQRRVHFAEQRFRLAPAPDLLEYFGQHAQGLGIVVGEADDLAALNFILAPLSVQGTHPQSGDEGVRFARIGCKRPSRRRKGLAGGGAAAGAHVVSMDEGKHAPRTGVIGGKAQSFVKVSDILILQLGAGVARPAQRLVDQALGRFGHVVGTAAQRRPGAADRDGCGSPEQEHAAIGARWRPARSQVWWRRVVLLRDRHEAITDLLDRFDLKDARFRAQRAQK